MVTWIEFIMDISLGEVTSNSVEREIGKITNGPERHQDSESLPKRKNSSQENEIRTNDNRNGPVRHDGLKESNGTLSSELKTILSQCINDRVIPEIQNVVGSLPLDQNRIGGTSLIDQRLRNNWRVKYEIYKEGLTVLL